jgi:hypothetical protein
MKPALNLTGSLKALEAMIEEVIERFSFSTAFQSRNFWVVRKITVHWSMQETPTSEKRLATFRICVFDSEPRHIKAGIS